MVYDEVTHPICLPTDHLWGSYSPADNIVTEVKQYLVGERWLSEKGKWGEIDGAKINKKQFVTRGTGDTEARTFVFFSRLFNAMLEYIRQSKLKTSVGNMVNVGYVEPESTRSATHRPKAFLHMATETPPTPGK